MKYVFGLESFTLLLERQTSHIKLLMTPALTELKEKGIEVQRMELLYEVLMKGLLGEVKFELSLKR